MFAVGAETHTLRSRGLADRRCVGDHPDADLVLTRWHGGTIPVGPVTLIGRDYREHRRPQRLTTVEGDLRRELPVMIPAILVAVFILNADFHPTRRSTFVVRTVVSISV